MQKRIKAFTLVELIVVMAIIAILVGLGIMGVSLGQRSLRDTQRVKMLEAINLEIESIRSNGGVYPTLNVTTTPFAGTVTLVSNTQIAVGTIIINLAAAATNAEATTVEGSDYCYSPNSNRSDYSLMVQLENGNTQSFGTASPCTLGTEGL